MTKGQFRPFGESPVEKLVNRFFERNGINPRDITDYRISRSATGPAVIQFTMFFDEDPAEKEED